MVRCFLFTIIVTLIAFKASTKDFDIEANNIIVADSEIGRVIFEKNSHEKISPASITKLMVAYITFEALKKGDITLNTTTVVSKNAYQKGHYTNGVSSMFLNIKEVVSVDNLLRGMIVISGNDAAIVIGEMLAGSEEEFIVRMNAKAKILGMNNTNFVNIDGVYDDNHYSTAADLYLLSNAIIADFPEYYHYFAIENFTHNGITSSNRNTLLSLSLNNNVKVDGLKTGHVEDSKYSLAFSAIKNDTFRLTGVVINLKSKQKRTSETKKLIDWLFNTYERKIFYKKGDLIATSIVYNGTKSIIEIKAPKDIVLVLPKNILQEKIKITLTYKNYYVAPVALNRKIATLDINFSDSKYNASYDIYPVEDIKISMIIYRYLVSPYYAIKKLLG